MWRRPIRRRTWAPAGPTPIISANYQQDRLSTLAAFIVSPKRQLLGLYLRCQPKHCQAVDGADCLRALWRHRRGHVVLLWDRGSIPKGPAMEAVCQASPRLYLEEFPA